MFDDVTAKKICATTVDKPVAKGGFGAVYKVKLASVSLVQTSVLLDLCIL